MIHSRRLHTHCVEEPLWNGERDCLQGVSFGDCVPQNFMNYTSRDLKTQVHGSLHELQMHPSILLCCRVNSVESVGSNQKTPCKTSKNSLAIFAVKSGNVLDKTRYFRTPHTALWEISMGLPTFWAFYIKMNEHALVSQSKKISKERVLILQKNLFYLKTSRCITSTSMNQEREKKSTAEVTNLQWSRCPEHMQLDSNHATRCMRWHVLTVPDCADCH